MRDIPMFTTEYGVAGLALGEIPYRQEAYITIHSSSQAKELLEECIGFCRACGAEKIYARNHEFLENYPFHAAIVKMRGMAIVDENMVANLWPVTEETVSRWRQFMNERLENVDNAATLTLQDEKKILEGGAYFVHENGKLLGGGWLAEGKLLLIAAAVPGAGERVLHTLLSLQPDMPLELEVASTNTRAIRLYEKMGLLAVEEIHRWYKVF